MPTTADLKGVTLPAETLASLQADYVQRWQKLLETAANHASPGLPDRRFAHETWHDNGPFTWSAAIYLLNAEFMKKMADAVQGDARARDRVRFATEQWVDMLSPSNFLATNPEAQLRMIENADLLGLEHDRRDGDETEAVVKPGDTVPGLTVQSLFDGGHVGKVEVPLLAGVATGLHQDLAGLVDHQG